MLHRRGGFIVYHTQLENGKLHADTTALVVYFLQSCSAVVHCRGGFIVYRKQLENGTLHTDATIQLDLGLVPHDYAQVGLWHSGARMATAFRCGVIT